MNQRSLFGSSGNGSATANIDGGSRGNPGPAGYGVRIRRDDEVIDLKGALSSATNNVAEYSGLLAALDWAVANGIATLHIRSDSELLIKQMRGEYRVKAEVSARARPGVVNGMGIWWRKLGLDGTNVNELTSQHLTDMGRGPVFYDCLVQVQRDAQAA